MSTLTGKLELRPLQEHDLLTLHDWLNRAHVVQWWGGEAARPSMAEVLQDYHPAALAAEGIVPHIALLDGVPIGFAQSYVAMASGEGWWPDETDPGVRGIDQFLADAALLGKGLGTRLACALVDLLHADARVTKIQADPAPDNLRAIRCYEKAGFQRLGVVVTPDGPAVYMVRNREARLQPGSDGALVT